MAKLCKKPKRFLHSSKPALKNLLFTLLILCLYNEAKQKRKANVTDSESRP
jgi:hypothetical protein